MTPFQLELATLIIDTLFLEEVTPDAVDPDAPLFYEGLGLDSIDALELSLAISKAYGVKIRSDDERTKEIFSSLKALAAYVEENRG
jgi:acyl carrier protein